MTRRLRSPRVRRGQRGFTVIEMLFATAIMMSVTAATFALMNPAHGMFAAQPEVMDMQQRLRIGVDTLYKDLLMAGAGTYSGSMTGSLGHYFSPIMPVRIGNQNPDPAGSFFTDRITVMYVPPTPAQTSIRTAMPNNSSEIKVNQQPGCPKNDPLCGFSDGMQLMIMDASGSWDTFNVTHVQDEALHLQHRGEDLNKAYNAGAYIAQINMYTYWLKTDTVAETYQLMRYDGHQSDVPIADNVVGLFFEYYGEPAPPQLRPGMTPSTTYGPAPPALGVDNPADNWGAGENCIFTVSAGVQIPRLSTLTAHHGLVKLTQAQLTDGPWCPDSAQASRFDADLLRIRKVRVTMRVQVADKSMRGPVGPLFVRGGTSRGAERLIRDQEIKFDVTARNLGLGR